jgi:tRNA nucleotidyltransferase (CCA-adding enzyme)
MKIKIPYLPKLIIYNLNKMRYKAYVVGGAVRDSLLNRPVKDWDITTNATPDQVKKVIKNAFPNFKILDTGLKHGTVTIMMDYAMDNSNVYSVEITTFRIDGKYSDNRKPDNVSFTDSLYKDLSRRDFTINALAYNDEEGLIDYFGGQQDLFNRIIRCVGNPNERFFEDALRMLRAIRFKSQLNCSLDSDIINSIDKNAHLIQKVSYERIQDEINKILCSDHPEYLLHYTFKLLSYIIPELLDCFKCDQNNPYHIYTVGVHILHSLKYIEQTLYLRLTMLLHDIGKPSCKTTDENGIDHFYRHSEVSSDMAVDILKKLKYDNLTIMRVRDLILYHDTQIEDSRKAVKRWLNKIGEDIFRDLLKVREADIKAQNADYYQERHDKIERIKIILEDILRTQDCFTKKDLALNGTDLINIGYPEGKEIGLILNYLLEKVLDNPELNTREKLIELLKLR